MGEPSIRTYICVYICAYMYCKYLRMWIAFLSTFLLIQGVFVMDRLSLAHIGSVQAITNGDVLSTVMTTLTKETLGTLEHIDVLKIGRKRLAVVYSSPVGSFKIPLFNVL